MHLSKTAILLLSAFILTQCTLPYEAESFDYERAIVVDALITDEEDFHTVSLTYTYPIGEAQSEKLSNAEVWVEVEGGATYVYEETEEGVYRSQTIFRGEAGKTYQLFFTTPEGSTYASEAVTLIDSPPIDSIYDRYVEIITEASDDIEIGIQFYVDTHDESSSASYYRFEWYADYELKVPYPSLLEYFPEEDSVSIRLDQVHTCYLSEKSSSIILGNVTGSTENRLAEQPIHFVSNNLDHLRDRYALQVSQFAIDEATYSFYKNLKESNESTGSLFDQQQGSIAGNVVSLDDPTETVLGYFEVSGVTRQRVFFEFFELDERLPRPDFRYYCDIAGLIESPEDSLFYYASSPTARVLGSFTNADDEVIFNIHTQTCADCSWYAPTEPPVYWID